MNTFNKVDRTMKLMAIYSFALSLGVGTVLLAHVFATLFVFGVFQVHPPLERVTQYTYDAWVANLLGMFLILMFVPKGIIYFKGGGKHRYKFLLYFFLPFMIWLLMPTLVLIVLGWTLVAVGAYAEAITIVRRLEEGKKKK